MPVWLELAIRVGGVERPDPLALTAPVVRP